MRILLLKEQNEPNKADYLFLTKGSAEYFLTQGISGDYHTFDWDLAKVTIRYKLGNKTESRVLYYEWREAA